MEGISAWWEFISERPDQIWTDTFDHFMLVVQVMLAAAVVCVVLGVMAHRIPALKGLVLGTASVLLTVPALALFAVSIPLVGIGYAPTFIALFLYAFLPILRNTVTGLDGVDPAVIESAKGMGLNARQRLIRVELPLAWPVILTGIRVSTLLVTGIAAIAVLVGGPGLGTYIQSGLNRYPLPTSVERVWTGVIFTIVLALVLDALYALIHRLTTPAGIRS